MAGGDAWDARGGWVDDATFYSRFARHAGLEYAVLGADCYADPDHVEVNPLAARLLTEELARHFGMLPVAYRDGVVSVALCDPFDTLAIDLATSLTAARVQPVIAHPEDLEQAIERTFGPLRPPHFEDLGPPPSGSPMPFIGSSGTPGGGATP
jgi:hypothetical protein